MKRWLALLLCGMLLLPALSASRAEGDDSGDTGFTLTLTLPEKAAPYAERLTDGYPASRVSLRAEEGVTISLDAPARALALRWYDASANYTLLQADALGKALSETAITDGMLSRLIPLDEACRTVTLTLLEPGSLAEIAVYPASEPLPETAQDWEQTPEKVDLLLICAEPGAEWKYLGGVLPIYARERGITAAVIYLSDFGKRARAYEALAGLWSVGIRAYPIFAGFTCDNYDSPKIVESGFVRAAVVKYLAAQIEALTPKVVVTHGADGRLDTPGAAARAFAGECALKAAEQTGAACKLYRFGAEEGKTTTVLDMNAPLNAFDGRTAAEIAQEAFKLHASQQLYGKTVDTSGAFTLAYTSVGEDEQKNDLFEHIDAASLLSYAPATPSPSPSPVPTPTPTAEPAPASAQTDEKTRPRPLGARLSIIALLAGSALTALSFLLLYRRIKAKRSAGDAVCACLLPLAVGLAVCALSTEISHRAVSALEPTQAVSAPAAAPTPKATPTSEPTPTSAPTLTPEEAFEANYYRRDGEPEEVVVVDAEHGHWAYRTDELGIDIDRIETVNGAGKPVVYFVADIHMKNIHQFRAGFGSEGHTGRGAIYPWIIARRAKAVLWITGDNLINSEREEKGILIRDGRLFAEVNAESTLAVYPDMSMRIYEPWETRGGILLEDGVENAFSFGPTLVEDGVVNEGAKNHRVRRANPRAGIGCVESGHYIAIVVDGRQKDYSVGMTTLEFAELFAEYGCALAYNLDGGLSAGMIFMGEQINSHAGRRIGASNDISYQRAVPDGLMFGYSALVPGEDEPVYNNGNRS